MPRAVLNAIAIQHHVNPHKGDMLSATSLPRCPRKLLLSRTRDYFEEPTKLWDAGRGTLIHGVLEMQQLENVNTEQRLFKKVTSPLFGEFVISGQMDFYDAIQEKLEDYKSCEADAVYTLLRYGLKDDHILQLSVYRWLMHGGHIGSIDGPQVVWPVKTAQLHYVQMRRIISTGSVFTFDIKEWKEPNYGRKFPGEISRERIQEGRGKPKWRIVARLPEVELLSLEETEEYVRLRGPNLVRGFRDDSYMPPGVMNDPDNAWECRYCGVKKLCDEIEQANAAPLLAQEGDNE